MEFAGVNQLTYGEEGYWGLFTIGGGGGVGYGAVCCA